jgi:hypothetical protein
VARQRSADDAGKQLVDASLRWAKSCRTRRAGALLRCSLTTSPAAASPDLF